jgi:hypothetical protein
MKLLIPIAFSALVIFILGCEKYVTPNKINKKLTKGTWRIAELQEDDSNLTVQYQDYKFTFQDGGKVSITGDTVVNGSWELGEEKNPTLMFLSFPLTEKTTFFVDDWLVKGISRTECYMTRNDESKSTDLIRLRLIE